MTIRIVIADDQDLFREGLAALLAACEGYELVGVASDGDTALSLVKVLRPDMLLLDVRMPGMDGMDCCRTLHRRFPNTRILALSGHGDWRYVAAMLQAGADGFALKGSGLDALLTGIRQVCGGEKYFDAALGALPIENDQLLLHSATLSSRERQVAKLLAEGKTNASVADLLKISVKTVESHRARIFAKLEIRSIAELVRLGIREGWVEP